MRPSEHINLVAILHVAWSVLLLMASGLVFVILGTGGLFAEHEETAVIAFAVAMFASGLLAVTGLAGLIGAYGLFRRRGWARFTVLVLSAVWLLKVPIGTALGAYSFYALTRDPVVALFDAPGPPPTPGPSA